MLLCSGWPVSPSADTWCELKLQLTFHGKMQPQPQTPDHTARLRIEASSRQSIWRSEIITDASRVPSCVSTWKTPVIVASRTGVIDPYVTIGSPGRSRQNSSIVVYSRGGYWMPRLQGWGWLIHTTRWLMTLAEGRRGGDDGRHSRRAVSSQGGRRRPLLAIIC